MTKEQPLRVVIVGAGFAGLTAAIALGREGHRVVVCLYLKSVLNYCDIGLIRKNAGAGKVSLQ